MIRAQVHRQPAGARRQPRQAELGRQLGADLAGAHEAILQAGVPVVDRAQLLDLDQHGFALRTDLLRRRAVDIARGTARDHAVHHQPVAEDLLRPTQPVLAQARELRQAERQRGVVAERTEVAEVVGDAFSFQQQRPQPAGARRDRAPRGCFQRHAVGPRVGNRRIARYAPGEAMRIERCQLGEALLDPLVGVAQPLLQAQHLFADDRKAEMPWLDDAGVHRADRDLVDPVTGDANEGIVDHVRAFADRTLGILLAQGEPVRGPGAVVEPRPRVACTDRDDPEQVGGGTLHPHRARKLCREIGIGRRIGVELQVEPGETVGERIRRADGEAARLAPAPVRAPDRDEPATGGGDGARGDLPRVGVDAGAPDRQRRRQAIEF